MREENKKPTGGKWKPTRAIERASFPRDIESAYIKAVALYNFCMYDEAISCFHQVLEAPQSFHLASMALIASCHMKKRDYVSALKIRPKLSYFATEETFEAQNCSPLEKEFILKTIRRLCRIRDRRHFVGV